MMFVFAFVRLILEHRRHPVVKKSATPQDLEKQAKKRISGLEDLPNELLLVICQYLSPTEVLDGFLQYNSRTSQCISDYSLRMNLTNYSYGDLQYILTEFMARRLVPSTLLVSNRMVPKQIATFFSSKLITTISPFQHVRQLSLLDCKQSEFGRIKWYVKIFPYLNSLCLTQSVLDNRFSLPYSTHELLCGLIFNSNLIELAVITLMINEGIVLKKQSCSNKILKRLAVALRTIDDLLVLLDGLVPNLIELHVTICTTRAPRQLLLPPGSPSFPMSHLTEFRLTTSDGLEMQLEYLVNVIKPLTQLVTLKLDVKRWASSDHRFPQGNQFESIIDKFMPRLQYFYCSIQTKCEIDMKTFAGLNKRWPIACRQTIEQSKNHLYTVPWSFEYLTMSELANDDTVSVCPNVTHLTVDVPCWNWTQRFPNINELIVLWTTKLNADSFPRLRRLTTTELEVLSSGGRQIHTLTLIGVFGYPTSLTIYPNIRHLVLDRVRVSSLETTTSLVRCFPNLRSLQIQFSMNQSYFDSLDVLLDGQHLPHLTLLKTNWVDGNYDPISDINMWIAEKTILKWRLKPFLAFGDRKDWFVWL